MTPCSVHCTASRSPDAATTPSSTEPGPACRGPYGHRSRRTCCATPRSTPSAASAATPSPKHSPDTPRRRWTGLYLRSRPCEVAAAVATLTDEPHPLADSDHLEHLM